MVRAKSLRPHVSRVTGWRPRRLLVRKELSQSHVARGRRAPGARWRCCPPPRSGVAWTARAQGRADAPRSDCQDRTAPALPVCAVPDRTRGRRRRRVSCAAAAHGGLFCDPANITFLTATEASGNNERHLVGRGRALRGCPLAALRGWRPLRAVGAAAPRAVGSLRGGGRTGGGRTSGRGGVVSATCAAGAHLPSFPPLSFLKIDAVEGPREQDPGCMGNLVYA